jgi:hypothetical protein
MKKQFGPRCVSLNRPAVEFAMDPVVQQRSNNSLDSLNDLQKWLELPSYYQDQAIQEVARRFDSAWKAASDDQRFDRRYELKSISEWTCNNHKDGKVRALKHRLGSFVNKTTGMTFQLLPGQGAIKPILIARRPFVYSQVFDLPSDLDPETPAFDKLGELFPEAYRSHGMRLPTREEWIYASLSSAKTRFYWGDEISARELWYKENSVVIGPEPHPVWEHEKVEAWNAFGLIDTIGNAWELCSHNKQTILMGGCYESSREDIEQWQDVILPAQQHLECAFRPAVSIPEIPQ